MFTVPQVSLNGTCATDIFEQHLAVLEAARVLKAALYACRPHGRDYQYHPECLPVALAEWTVDAMALESLMERADDIAGHVLRDSLNKTGR
jgi:hypothetical protein